MTLRNILTHCPSKTVADILTAKVLSYQNAKTMAHLTATSPFIKGHHIFIMWQWTDLSTSQLSCKHFQHLFTEDVSTTVCHLLKLYSGGNKQIWIQTWRTGKMLLTRKTTALGATPVPVPPHLLQFPREIKPSPLQWEVTT